MKHTLRKLMTVAMAMAMLLPTMAACRKNPGDSDDLQKRVAVQERVTNVYKGDYISVPESINLYTDSYTLVDDAIIFLANEMLNEGDPDTGVGYESRKILYTISLSGGDAQITPLTQQLSGVDGKSYAYISEVAVARDGSYVVYEYQYQYASGAITHLLTGYKADGTVAYSVDPEAYQQIRTDPRAERYGWEDEYSFYIHNMALAANGNLYIFNDYSILALNAAGERLYETEFNGYVRSVAPTADGRVLVTYMDYTDYEEYTAYMDDDKRGFTDPISVPAISFDNYEILLGAGYDYYLKTDTGLYGLNETDEAPVLLCNWINSDVNCNAIRSLRIMDAESFLYIGNDPVTYDTEIAIMRHIADEEVPEKYIIRIGSTYFDYEFPQHVIKFNRSSDDYRIVLVDYTEYNTADDYDAGEKQLQADILAGNTPDILYSCDFTDTINSYAEKGLFVDLYTFLDADPTFKENLLPCILTPFETDGKLYQISTGFTIQGFVGKTKNIGQYVGNWTVDTLLDAIAECEQKGVKFMPEMTRETMELNLITLNLGSYINYENATCDFTSDTFLKTIRFLKSLPTNEQYYEDYDWSTERNDDYAGMRNDTVLMRTLYMYELSEYLQSKATMMMEDITILGLPTPEGGALSISGTGTYSIAAESPVQEAAWSFVKYMFENISVESHGGSMPATYSALQTYAEDAMRWYYVFDLDGGGWSGTTWDGETPPEDYYDPEREIPGYLTQADVDALYSLLETSNFRSNLYAGSDDTLNDLIAEELGAYYADQSSAEDAAKKIQSRVSIYLSERS